MTLLRHTLYVLLLLLIAGCSEELRKEPAVKMAERFYSAIERENYREVLTLFSPEFFSNFSEKEFLKELEKKRQHYGTLRRYRIVTWEVWKESRMGKSGVYYRLWYLVTYSRTTLMEHFLMFRPITTNKLLIHEYSWSTEHRIKRGKR